MAITNLMTAEQLEQMEDDGYRYDLIDGELIRMPPAGDEHGELAMGFGARLWGYVTQNGLGTVYAAETGFILRRDPDVVLGPDIAFVRTDRLPIGRDRSGYVDLVPDLAVEVISPSERRGQVARKVQRYLDAGVPLLVLVYPRRRSIVVHRLGQPPETLTEGETFDGGDVLPGFRLPVADIFV